MSRRRLAIALGGALSLVLVVMLAVASGSRPASAVQFPDVKPTPVVCSTTGACVEADNKGQGMGFLGQAIGKNAIGVRGIAPSTSLRGTGISGQVFGPTSIAVNGRSFSTDPTNPSEGVVGLSANAAGVIGTTTFNSPLAITGAAGVHGDDKSTQFGFDMGIEGTTVRGVGVAAISKNGNAVTASSANANGIVAQTTFFATSGQGQAGVLGQDLATPNPQGSPTVNVGVEGTTLYGTGVFGQSTTGVGIKAFSSAGTAMMVQSNGGPALVAVGPVSIMPGATGGGLAVSQANITVDQGDINAGGGPHGGGTVGGLDAFFSAESQIAITAFNQATPGPDAPPTLFLDSEIGGPIMQAANGGTNEFSLDGSGNMILAGTLTQNGTPLVSHRQPNGWGVGTYSAQETTRTVEDLGEAQLEGGQAYVHLDPAYTAVTDMRRTYLVFITPQGDCRGLYVTQKTQAGFAVQETGQGRSSIAFDYRIVAPSRDSSGVRLPKIPPMRNYRVRRTALHHSLALERPFSHSIPSVRAGYVPSNSH